MTENVKKVILDSMQEFEKMPEDEKLVYYGKMITAVNTLDMIVSHLKAYGSASKLLENQQDVIRFVTAQAAAYMTLGTEIGFSSKKEDEDED